MHEAYHGRYVLMIAEHGPAHRPQMVHQVRRICPLGAASCEATIGMENRSVMA